MVVGVRAMGLGSLVKVQAERRCLTSLTLLIYFIIKN